jgi:hypothetical protein
MRQFRNRGWESLILEKDVLAKIAKRHDIQGDGGV